MRSLVSLIAGLLLLASVARAQRATEWQVFAVGQPTGLQFAGGGLGFGIRSFGRLRAGLAVAGGAVENAAAGHGEVMLSYHANPVKRRGVTPYAGGGFSVTATRDASTEYLLVVVGVESHPGRPSGWFVEAGVSGGVRIAAGWRFRAFRR